MAETPDENKKSSLSSKIGNMLNDPYFARTAAGLSAETNDVRWIRGEFGGRRFECDYWCEIGNNFFFFKIILFATFPTDMWIKKESFSTRAGKKIGVLKEIETGHKDFDDKYFIKASDTRFGMNYLLSDSNRATVDDIFSSFDSMHELRFSKDFLQAYIFPCEEPALHKISADKIKETLARLERLLEFVPGA